MLRDKTNHIIFFKTAFNYLSSSTNIKTSQDNPLGYACRGQPREIEIRA